MYLLKGDYRDIYAAFVKLTNKTHGNNQSLYFTPTIDLSVSLRTHPWYLSVANDFGVGRVWGVNKMVVHDDISISGGGSIC